MVEIQREKLSPMMLHYLDMKQEHPDCVLLYRIGDFYEMFFEDAIKVSKELELTLTGKDCGLDERAPMCGVPHHSADGYITRLVKKGYKVAIAEQVEDPKLAKGLVKREIIRIVTPGTITEDVALESGKNNFLLCIIYMQNIFGLCATDISTGDCMVTQIENVRELYDEISRFEPSEVLGNNALLVSGIDMEDMKTKMGFAFSQLSDNHFSDENSMNIIKQHFHVSNIEGLGLVDMPIAMYAVSGVLEYLYETQMNACSQITNIITYTTSAYMHIDSSSRRNLELTQTMRDKEKRGSLLWVLDKTKTAMGARLLRNYIEHPLIRIDDINSRQDVIEEFVNRYIDREELAEYLEPIYDLERLVGKISLGSANARDMLSFSRSISMIPTIRRMLGTFESSLLKNIYEDIDELGDINTIICEAIYEEAPATLHDGDLIKSGYNEEVDTLRRAKTDGKIWLAELESKERELTGIKNLKIKYNKVFGYYLEVTNSYKNLVPDRYIRKQTLTGAERYTTDELKKMEDEILGAEDRLLSLEYNIFVEIRQRIAGEAVRILATSKKIAMVDVFVSLAKVAYESSYCRPTINEKGSINIKDGRHPVIEKIQRDDMFVTNDTILDSKERIAIITGPNMAGKSTYMRQSALIVLMAQMGSFVPATFADICICDKIFTRVGASDDLASGKSTFMVEMSEVANILRNATNKSLVILDEIGRGTSTFDGLSIAWAVVEYLAEKKIMTLFATHYHELTELEGSIAGVKNYCITVKEKGDSIVFLRKIEKGGADKSYGIQVAKLAGVPEHVINRAKELSVELEDADITVKSKHIVSGLKAEKQKSLSYEGQLSIFDIAVADNPIDKEIIENIKQLDISDITPREAVDILYSLQEKIQNK